MQPRILKLLLDIESVITEIEFIKQKSENNFKIFQKDIPILLNEIRLLRKYFMKKNFSCLHFQKLNIYKKQIVCQKI